MNLHIGCSGFYYSHWKEIFYPEKLARKRWLEYYSEHFDTVEINNTFYGWPKENVLKQWVERTPDGFKFTIKGQRYFTHLKKMIVDDDVKGQLDTFQQTIKVLGTKIGCVLWQLPGSLTLDLTRLESFCRYLDPSLTHVIEFRHNSWFNDLVLQVMQKYNVSFCMISAPGNLASFAEATTATAYLRFHGIDKWYNYLYTPEQLQRWKNDLIKLKGVSQLYVYFNNDAHGYAIRNARELRNIFHV